MHRETRRAAGSRFAGPLLADNPCGTGAAVAARPQRPGPRCSRTCPAITPARKTLSSAPADPGEKGRPTALTLVGFTGGEGSFTVTGPEVATPRLQVGEGLLFTATVANTSGAAIKVAVDYVIGHLKANGTQAPHVFRLATRTLAPGETTAIRRSHPFRVITTRRYYPGPHSLRLQVNGHLSEPAAFTLDAPEPAAALAGPGSR
jgi:hypothetical protein